MEKGGSSRHAKQISTEMLSMAKHIQRLKLPNIERVKQSTIQFFKRSNIYTLKHSTIQKQ